MKLIVGLGNVGEKYERTRHNVGFMVIDRLMSEGTWKKHGKKGFWTSQNDNDMGGVRLFKPKTFMNESGRAVARLKNFYKIDLGDLMVVHDDLDIRLGEYKIQKGVGPKVHNGVLSVEKELRSKEFWRVRVGVDGRRLQAPARGGQAAESSEQLFRKTGSELPFAGSGEEYVLGRFRREEQEIIDEVIKKIVKETKDKICT